MKQRIQRVGILSVGKMHAVIFLILGLFIGIITYLVAKYQLTPDSPAPNFILMLVALPLLYVVMGFFLGIICAWLYNLVAKRIGGIEIELEK